MTHHEWEHVQDASRAIRAQWAGEPRVGIVLGTGLGALAREIEAASSISLASAPRPVPRTRPIVGVPSHCERTVRVAS